MYVCSSHAQTQSNIGEQGESQVKELWQSLIPNDSTSVDDIKNDNDCFLKAIELITTPSRSACCLPNLCQLFIYQPTERSKRFPSKWEMNAGVLLAKLLTAESARSVFEWDFN